MVPFPTLLPGVEPSLWLLQRGSPKPSSIPWSELPSRNNYRELYRSFCHIVWGVIALLLANMALANGREMSP
jgi:hypothetical protein